MGRPLLPIWKEFATTVPSGDDKRSPDVECIHCRTAVCNARPLNLVRHAMRCSEMPESVIVALRNDLPPTRAPPAVTVTRQELETAVEDQEQQQNQTQTPNRGEVGEEEEEIETETSRPILGKRPRAVVAIPTVVSIPNRDNLERVLTSIRDVMAKTLECKQQELQLRREELEFQREALATKMEDKRQAREEYRRDKREQREADRQEKLELARIENEKNLAFLKAVMESSTQQRR